MTGQCQYSVERGTRFSNIASSVLLLIVAGLAFAPYWTDRGTLRLLSEFFNFLTLAMLWNLLAGFVGLVSVGQQAYVGAGGYAFFALIMSFGIPPLLAIPLSGFAGALCAVPSAFLLFRLKGAYFAIGTWVMAEVLRLASLLIPTLGGGSGLSLPVAVVRAIAETRDMREWLTYWSSLTLAVLVMASIYLMVRSRLGLAMTSIRDSEIASESLGIRIWMTKFVLYVGVGAVTAITGALIFLQKLRITPDAAFSVNDWTAFIIFIAVIGGVGTLEGPIAGTLIFFMLRQTMAELGTIYLMVLGALAIVVMLRAPRGVWGTIARRFDVELLPVRQKLIDRPPVVASHQPDGNVSAGLTEQSPRRP
jgi:branched-chain amino acid transport system permease protein